MRFLRKPKLEMNLNNQSKTEFSIDLDNFHHTTDYFHINNQQLRSKRIHN